MLGLGKKLSSELETDSAQSLAALLSTSTLGVAICDRQLRFQTVNDALASMNGMPAEAHIGKTIYQILGTAAARVEPAFRHVFATGNALSNFELTARPLGRSETGHWIENYFPIRTGSGKVVRVGAIVLEVTRRKKVEQSLNRLTGTLHRASKALQTQGDIRRRINRSALLSAVPLELLEDCMSEARIVSEMLRPQFRLEAVQHQQIVFEREVEQVIAQENRLSLLDSQFPMSELRIPCLSQRERQVVQHLAMGKSNKEMATILNLSVRTVETYRARVMLKLGICSVAGLVRYALRNNII